MNILDVVLIFTMSGLSDTAAYGTLAIINYFCFKFADDPFLVFFERFQLQRSLLLNSDQHSIPDNKLFCD